MITGSRFKVQKTQELKQMATKLVAIVFIENSLSNLTDVNATFKYLDWHSHSYFMLPELLKSRSKLSDVSPEFAQDTLSVLERLSEGDPESVRVVFWFDN
ncbi:hypothetical protein SAMN05443246_2398 [Paenibacillus sp. GP183]|nr:hypothetical protein SAMN05443246_2398 [Paenibacillus sp. GP183]